MKSCLGGVEKLSLDLSGSCLQPVLLAQLYSSLPSTNLRSTPYQAASATLSYDPERKHSLDQDQTRPEVSIFGRLNQAKPQCLDTSAKAWITIQGEMSPLNQEPTLLQ
ncbi:rCG57248 [Rattus norvegicus]|uniref:RCG57248 n=1 Tax=Rattus norvegicus TaxID=10116 RepID=A6KPJ8_RAT|nr:rCG57248 [Rattus norvegicus]